MRRAIIGSIGVLAILSVPFATSATEAGPSRAQDSLWLSWIGCWEGAAEVGGDETDSFLVCFRPRADGVGVDILTYSEGELTAVEEMLADDTPRPLVEGGCEGERSAGWSLDQSRVFLISELECGEGVTRTTRGLMSMLPGRDGWVEIQSVQAGDARPLVGIRTFLPADAATLASSRIPDPSAGRELAVRTARAQASAALTPRTLVETIERAGPSVANALLVERGEPLGLESETLRALSQKGVPGEVLDVLVAMSYPERFEISGSGPELAPAIRSPSGYGAASRRTFRGYSPWGLGYDPYWDPFWSSSYRYGYGYNSFGYGYNSFGYGPFGYGYFGSSIYRTPRLIYIQEPTVVDRRTLSRNRGVVGGSDRTARPSSRSQPTSRAGSSRSGSSRAAPAPSRSRGGSRASPASSPSRGGSSGSSGGTRTARPR